MNEALGVRLVRGVEDRGAGRQALLGEPVVHVVRREPTERAVVMLVVGIRSGNGAAYASVS